MSADVCKPRSHANLGAVLDALDVEHRPEWQPGYGAPGRTHCSEAVKKACDELEAPMAAPPANSQDVWLASLLGRNEGWEACTLAQAGDAAELGQPAVVTLHEEPHGHIAMVRGRDEHGNLLLWQAGGHNYNRATLRQCFTVQQLEHVRFYRHA